MNKYQKKRYQLFKVWYPMACKNNNKVRNKNKNRQYRRFVWAYSHDTIDSLNDALDMYRKMAKLQGKNN